VSRKPSKRTESKAHLQQTQRHIKEALMIVLFATGLFFLVALMTYHQGDPGWSDTGSRVFFANAGGMIGAWLADIFLYVFGLFAYALPFMFLFLSISLFRTRAAEDVFSKGLLLLRSIGFLLALSAGCGFITLNVTWHAHLPLNAGGVLGELIGYSFAHVLNPLGADLVLLALFLIGVTLFIGFSWLSMMQVVGGVALMLGNWIQNQIRNGLAYLKARRASLPVSAPNRPKKTRIVIPKAIDKEIRFDEPAPAKTKQQPQKKPFLKAQETVGGLPAFTLLNEPKQSKQLHFSEAQLTALSKEVEKRLLDFGIGVSVVAARPGPVITRFELELAPGIKVSRISTLAKDLARALSVSSVRVVEVIPGKSVIGLEIPNEHRELVYLRDIFESKHYQEAASPLSLSLGKDISGYPVVVDLSKMPHLLVAGTTGSGKSVSINVMLLSLLFRVTPDAVRLILIDPKMLELSVYEGIPHLLAPVVTNMNEAANAFRWCVAEMDRRYHLMASLGVRNLSGYNMKVRQAIRDGNPILDPFCKAPDGEERRTLDPMPYIVVVVDELADMMMLVGKKVEELITRLAQKARAAGIHMILATQRPSVDVITGLIKANIPTRISFQVSSRIDSRTILDQQGAEQLLGHGDMLYLPPGTAHPIRVHGAFVSDEEVHRAVADWRQRGEPEYVDAVLEAEERGGSNGEMSSGEESDPLYDQAVFLVTESRRASISYVQRRFKIGYNRAARLLEMMEEAGIVSTMSGSGSREVLAPPPPPASDGQ